MVDRKSQSRGLGRGLGSLIPALTPPAGDSDAKVAPPSEDANPASYRTGRQGIDTFFPQGDDRTKRRASDLASSLAGDMRASRRGKATATKSATSAATASAEGGKSFTPEAKQGVAAQAVVEASAEPAVVDGAATETPKHAAIQKTTQKKAPARTAKQPALKPVVDAQPVSVAEDVEVSRETIKPETVNEPAQTAESESSVADPVEPVVAVVPADDEGPELVPVPGAAFADLPVDSIRPNPRQPREVFDEEALEELVFSVREIGVLQPIVVRPIPESMLPAAPEGVAYEIIMGERRWRASKAADKDTVPAIIRTTSDDDLLRDALLENLHRSQLNPLEEAAAYSQLLDDFGCTQEELANRIGRSRPQISNMMRLMKLPPLVQRRVAAGVLSMGHARALLGLKDSAAIERLAQKVVAEGLSVRATEELVALGADQAPDVPARRIGRTVNPVMDDIAGRLSDRFDTRVKIAMGTRRGKLTVEFSGMDDLQRILDVIAPGAEGHE